MKGKIFTFLVLFCYASLSAGLNAQRSGTIVMEDVERAHFRKEILIPDIAGYLTLKCDFHMHTVFSDGNVWPTVRVDASELPARFVLPRRGTLVLRAKQVRGKAQNYLYRLENVLTGIEEYPFFTITVK